MSYTKYFHMVQSCLIKLSPKLEWPQISPRCTMLLVKTKQKNLKNTGGDNLSRA